jgi:hypothetical protein
MRPAQPIPGTPAAELVAAAETLERTAARLREAAAACRPAVTHRITLGVLPAIRAGGCDGEGDEC